MESCRPVIGEVPVGIGLEEFITRLRGNPVALSSLLVAVVAAFAAFAVAKPDANVLAAGLIGASVSALVGLLITFLGEPDLRAVPRRFLEAVKHELTESGYYRSNHRYTVTLTEHSPLHIQIVFSSLIVPSGKNSRVKPPQIEPPYGISIVDKEYKIDGFHQDFDAEFELDRIKNEMCSVTYRVDKTDADIIKETHRWSSPIDGFTLTAHLPDGYNIRAATLAGLSLQEEKSHTSAERIFLRNAVAFSQQGITWSINKAHA
jgi:hypothetical protein